jgi:hypothetical protein
MPRSGKAPVLVFTAGLGLLVCAGADALSRATVVSSPLMLWAGILLITVPIFYRLTSDAPSTRERFLLVCLLGLSLYAVKVLRDSPIYLFSDEQVHAYNADQIVAHHHLFRANPILRATPFFPGLEGATSALMSISGLSSYVCGIIVIAAARLTLMGSLFLLFLRVGGSARTAGLAGAIYVGNFNFLFWGAQYSYESLALPLLMLILMAFAEREASLSDRWRSWSVPIVVAIAALIITHHLTSYALFGILVGLSLATWWVRRSWRPPNPWPFAIFTGLLATAWLFVVASATVGYLSPVLSGAVNSIKNTVSGEAPGRGLFQKTSITEATPVAARAIAILAILLLAVGLVLGLRRAWPRLRRQPFVLLFALAALGFFATLPLRLAPAAWETGNRASEIFFVGLAFVVALAGIDRWRSDRGPRTGRILMTGFLAVVLVGGAIAAWPWDTLLTRPLRITAASGGTISSPPLGLGEWAHKYGPDGRYASMNADSRMLLVPGEKSAHTGISPNIEAVLTDPAFPAWERRLLAHNHYRYLVLDRRKVSSDGIRGYFFDVEGAPSNLQVFPKGAEEKFERLPGAARIYSSGPITIFDLNAYAEAGAAAGVAP